MKLSNKQPKYFIPLLFTGTLILTVCLLLPYSVHIGAGVVNVIDPLFYAWNLAHNASNAFSGMNALLNTNIFFPLTNTLSFSDTLWTQSIIANPIIWLTGNPILAENISVLLSFPLSAVFMFALTFYLTKNRFASIASGILFAFSYPRLSQIGHLPMITSQWLPLYLLFLFKFLDEGKRMNFFLLCLSYILAIASSIYFGVFLIPVTLIILAFDIIKRISTTTLSIYVKRFRSAFLILPVFLVTLIIVLFPYIRLKIENPELKRSIDDMTHLRATPNDYVSVLPTSLVASVLPNQTNEHALYPTLALLILASLGIILSWKRNRRLIVIFLTLGISSVILSFGDQQGFSIGPYSTGTLRLPYYYLYSYIPIFQVTRVPARFSIFVILSLTILASFGITEMMKKKYSWLIIGILSTLFFIEIWQVNTPFISVPLNSSIPRVYTWIEKQPEPMILSELPVSLFYHGVTMEDQLYLSYGDLQKKDTYALETYRVYFSSFHKKRMLDGYSGYLPDKYNRLSEMLENFPSDQTILDLKKTGITHVIVHSMQYGESERNQILSQLDNSPHVTRVYEDPVDFVYQIRK